jgi:hypothetical protein
MSPADMPRLSAAEREYRARRAAMLREQRLDEIAERGGRVTESKAYRSALARASR